jgi:uncharacterized protein YkuJ
MEPVQILSYFLDKWENVKQLALSTGLSRGFYPLVLPEYGDHRLIDTSLQATGVKLDQLITANITNPSVHAFEGLILDEKMEHAEENGMNIVNVTYLKAGEIYKLQCIRKDQGNLKSYAAIGVPNAISDYSSDELQKVYNELESLLN